MKKLWTALALISLASFLVLGWVGSQIYQKAPPIPERVVLTNGTVLIPKGQITRGQNVWQAMGGMEVGSVWGHGSYVAPDWTADYLHREAVFILNSWAGDEFGKSYERLSSAQQAVLKDRLQKLIRTNRYDSQTKTLYIEPIRARAFEANLKHYSQIFTKGSDAYAIHRNAQPNPEKLRELNSFFFWSSWAASTNRPGQTMSYTSNWPAEELVGNFPTADTVVWTGVSVIMLIASLGAMVWFYASRREEPGQLKNLPTKDPLLNWKATASQIATMKYFAIVSALFLLQIIMGVITVHYGVEGNGFYGIPLSELLPYVLSRTWHVQLAIFWIATAWLAAGLFIGPIISGVEPKGQRLGVNVLFGALLVVVLGSMAGQFLSIHHKFTGDAWFYFGHQGYEYLDLGRFWQIALFAGLLLWMFLIFRSPLPALKKPSQAKPLIVLYLLTTGAIALFYAAGLFYSKGTHLSIVEYWRWWVVHLWVEGFFEVFATVVIAFMFTRFGLVRAHLAAQAALLSGVIYLSGGIIGTLHHLYFAGTPTVAMAFGSVFSALEIVPLVFIGYEAWENIRRSKATNWMKQYKWPIYFFIAVAFWNLVGAGIFGFMINPPIALYYMQGLNTTAVHAHGAMFGVYGMLGLGLTLFCVRAFHPKPVWGDKTLSFAFWAINGGLMLEILLSLLPVGLLQTWASVDVGYWYARSPEFLQTSLMQFLRWMRMVGDILFALGAIAFVWFMLGLLLGFSFQSKK